jgi:hypothetical protein
MVVKLMIFAIELLLSTLFLATKIGLFIYLGDI